MPFHALTLSPSHSLSISVSSCFFLVLSSTLSPPSLSSFTSNSIRQYLASSTVDSSFTSGALAATTATQEWTRIDIHTKNDGSIESSNGATNGDDGPYVSIETPFLLPFNGRSYTRLFASPNGAIHFTSDMMCCEQRNTGEKCFTTTTSVNRHTHTLIVA